MGETSAAALSACSRCGSHIPPDASVCPVCDLPALAASLPRFSDTFLSTYEILEVLGKGGMGTVLKVRHRRLDRLVCVKLVNLVDPEMQARFLQEGRLLAKIDNERIIRVFDSACDNGLLPYLVCEYVEGRSLREVLDKEELPSLERSLDIALQILEGLEAAHTDHVIHRDIKPDNILITTAGKVKLADFGLARSTKNDMRRTSSGVMIGTPSYMAPEQITGQEISPATDLYATGVLLFELLTGKLPYEGRVPLEVLNQHVSGAIPRVTAMRPELRLPRALDPLIEMALAKDPANRFETAASFRLELEKIRDSLDEGAVSTGVHDPVTAGTPRTPGDDSPALPPRRTGTVAVARPRHPGDTPDPGTLSTSKMPRIPGQHRTHAMLGLLAVGCIFGAAFLRPVSKPVPPSQSEAQALVAKARVLVDNQTPKDAEGRTVDDLVARARRLEPGIDIAPIVDGHLRLATDMKSDGRLLKAAFQLDQALRWEPQHPRASSERSQIQSELERRGNKIVPIIQGPATRRVGESSRVVVYSGTAGRLALFLIEPNGLRTRLLPETPQMDEVAPRSETLWPRVDDDRAYQWELAGDHLLYAVLFNADVTLSGTTKAKYPDAVTSKQVLEKWIASAGPRVQFWTSIPFKVWPK